MLFCFDSREVQQNFETMIKSHTGHAVWWFWEIVYINFLLLISNWIMFHENCESRFRFLKIVLVWNQVNWWLGGKSANKSFVLNRDPGIWLQVMRQLLPSANHVNLQSFDTDQAFGCNLWSLSICFWPLFFNFLKNSKGLERQLLPCTNRVNFQTYDTKQALKCNVVNLPRSLGNFYPVPSMSTFKHVTLVAICNLCQLCQFHSTYTHVNVQTREMQK